MLMLVGGTGVVALVFVLAVSPLVSLLVPDLLVREPSGYLARLFAPLLVLLPLSVLLAGSLQAQGRFALAGLRQLCRSGWILPDARRAPVDVRGSDLLPRPGGS
jgi:hypothetical protein